MNRTRYLAQCRTYTKNLRTRHTITRHATFSMTHRVTLFNSKNVLHDTVPPLKEIHMLEKVQPCIAFIVETKMMTENVSLTIIATHEQWTTKLDSC